MNRIANLMCLAVLVACGKVVHIGTRVGPSQDAAPADLSGTPETSPTSGDGTSAGDGVLDGGVVADISPVISPPTDETDADVPPNASCDESVGASTRWSFSDSLDGWQVSSDQAVSLAWSEAVGAGASGAILATTTATEVDDAFVFVSTGMQDLSAMVLTVRLLVETDRDVSVKLFAQSGATYAWADGGVVTVTPGHWVCIALALDEPAFAANGFDASRVRRIGVAIRGIQYRVYLDDISY